MSDEGSGLIGLAKRLASTLISIVATRLELLANEFQEERLHLMQMLALLLLALFCFGVSLALLTVIIVVLFWDEYRMAGLVGLCILYFALGTVMAMLLRNRVRTKSKLFSVSIAELAKDKDQLDARHE